MVLIGSRSELAAKCNRSICWNCGGIRLGFEQAFGDKIKFVFANEIDKYAQQTYFANFGEMPYGDIIKIDERDIPPHDTILAGFPCQAFSVAGLRKGFEDTRGHSFLM